MAITKEEVLAAVSSDVIASRDLSAIAALASVGRTRNNGREIGTGTILETMGLATGTAVIDALYDNPSFKYVKPLIDQGRLQVGSPLVKGALDMLVAGGVCTQAQADAMYATGRSDDLVSPQEVEALLFNPDGSDK